MRGTKEDLLFSGWGMGSSPMPANLTPIYRNAEEAFKQARTTAEKLEALKHMLAVIPKHKGTEKLQADIKRKIAKLKEEPQKKGAKRQDLSYVPVEGAGQILLVGAPNAGKSHLLSILTHAQPEIASYPYTTRAPQPGIMFHQQVRIQIVDGPAVSVHFMEPWYPGLVRYADLLLLVLDLGADDALEQYEVICRQLSQHKVTLVPCSEEEDRHGSVARKRTILAANKMDLPGSSEVLDMVRDVLPAGVLLYPISSLAGQGIEELKEALFQGLHLIRIFGKSPGQKADMLEPFVFPVRATVMDAARSIHKDFAEQFRFARVWRHQVYEGQKVQGHFSLEDGDILEIHTAAVQEA